MPRPRGDTMERLLQAAVELIGEHGYSGTSIDEIVERAGVAKGTVYYHFSSKAALVQALLEDGLNRLAESFQREIEGAPTPIAALEALVRAELAYIQRYEAFAKLVMSEMWRVDRDWRNALQPLQEGYGKVIAGVLQDGMAAGEFRSDLDVRSTASALFGMVATGALNWLVFQRERPREEIERNLLGLVLAAVRA